MGGDQTPPLLLGPFLSAGVVKMCVYGSRARARERKHVRNFMSLGSFGIVLEVALIKPTEKKKRVCVFTAARRSPPQAATARHSPPQPVAARRSPQQLAAARRSAHHDRC